MNVEERIIQLEQTIASMEEQLEEAFGELEIKNELLSDLIKANSDFDNLLVNAEIGALFIDSRLKIRKITPIMSKNTNLMLADSGKSITEVILMEGYDCFVEDVKKCKEQATALEREVLRNGVTWLLRLCPYYVMDGSIEGVIVILFDITKRMEAAKFELQVLINNVPGAVVKFCYKDGLVLEYANDTLFEIMGITRETFCGQYANHFERTLKDREWERLQASIEESLAGNRRIFMEYCYSSGSGDTKWCVAQAGMIEQQGELFFQGVIVDTTERKKMQLALEREKEKLDAIIRMSGDMIFEYDIAHDCMTYACPGEGILFKEQITANYSRKVIELGNQEKKHSAKHLIDMLRGGRSSFSIEMKRLEQDGQYHWVTVMGKTIYDSDNRPEKVLGSIHNIDLQKKKEHELREKSQRDSMTGLLNHKTVKHVISKKLSKQHEGMQVYLVICDIDDFKSINDLNGHLFGDAVICSFADELTAVFPDAVIGRIGGDEFVFYVENIERNELQQRLMVLNRAMSDRFADDQMGLLISCSIGVGAVEGSVQDYETLFKWADSALYRVKSSGKGTYLIVDVMDNMTLPDKSYLASSENKEFYIRHEALVRTEEDLVLFCMEILEHAANITSALRMISERVCRFFDLDDMVCVEHHGVNKQVLYQWSRSNKSEYTHRMLADGVFDWNYLLDKSDRQGVILYSEEQTRTIETEEAKAVVIVLSKEIKHYQGSVVYTDRRKDRTWSQERGTLARISNLIFMHLRSLKEEERERAEVEKKLNYDTLTGLPVYSRFITLTTDYMVTNGKENLYCVYSDFSNFQYMNEVYGFEEGDKVLKSFAQKLRQSCPGGILFCRITSDHFVGLIRSESLDAAINSYGDLTWDFTMECNQQYVQSSLVIASGIYEVNQKDQAIASMMDKANEARKKCKEQKVVTAIEPYTEEIRLRSESIKSIMTNMVTGYNNKEFHAYLQPKVSIKTGKIIGAEALARWIRADGVRMMPGEFIDIFERNGFITKLDFCILDQVMEYLKESMSRGEELIPISVNFSRRNNEFKAFVPSIFRRLDEIGIPGELLDVEITESVFLSDFTKLRSNISMLRERGVQISVDDFGSGYSSLNVLSRVSVDTIKLDKQFLNNCAEEELKSLTIIKYLIQMLKQLGFKVLAEGVETKEQLEMLRLADCDIAQGYYFAKPMPMEEFRDFVREFNARSGK